MSTTDHVWDELNSIYSRWGLREIPFSESAAELGKAQLQEVFTGRENELREALSLFKGRARKRILVYGLIGIGKTAFMLEVLGVLQRKSKDTLTAFISLPPEMDLATAALIALARTMEDDEWAQHQLNQMGLRPRKTAYKRKEKVKAGIQFIEGDRELETLPVNRPQFPALAFEDLLERALKKYRRVVIAIDDLDKQDPARIHDLLRDAQGMLKGGAWFMLTGHPAGLTREIWLRELGLFDLAVELKSVDYATTYQMLINYLNSARLKKTKYNPVEPKAVRPFTLETARLLCERASGVPRWLNRLGSYVLLKAAELNAETITLDVLQKGFEYADKKLRGQTGLTPEDRYVLGLVLEKEILSDASITLPDLERVGAKEFSEILPTLEKLIQLDLVQRLPTERAAEFQPTPMILVRHAQDKQSGNKDT